MPGMPPPVKTGDDHDARVFQQKEQPIRKFVDARPPFPLIDNRVMQRTLRYAGDCVINRRCEAVPQFRPDGLIMGEGFPQFRGRFGKPNDG